MARVEAVFALRVYLRAIEDGEGGDGKGEGRLGILH
jgi:hypothetical protein